MLTAFAELQTEVLDMASDQSDVGPPFCDFTSYAFKMLFPAEHELRHRLCQLNDHVSSIPLHPAVLAMALCLSVRLSHAGIVSQELVRRWDS